MVEKVIPCQVQISNDLISSAVMCRSQVHRSKIFGLDENNPVFIGDRYIHFGNALSILSIDGRSVFLPEFEGEVLKGMFAEVLSFDRLS